MKPDPQFKCQDCTSQPCCPVCLKTDVQFIGTCKENVYYFDVINCLECGFSSFEEVSEDDEEEEDYPDYH